MFPVLFKSIAIVQAVLGLSFALLLSLDVLLDKVGAYFQKKKDR